MIIIKNNWIEEREEKMNKSFAGWYRIANIEPTREQLENRWNGISNFIENQLVKDDIFELVKMFYSQPTEEEFRDRYVECFVEADSVFDRNNGLELSVLAGTTLIKIIEDHSYSMLAIFATMSFSFFTESPVVPNIIETIKENFCRSTCSTREDILDEDNIIQLDTSPNELIKTLQANPTVWTQNASNALINYLTETHKFLKHLYEKERKHKAITKVYREDSQILWWMTGQWSNDLDKSLNETKKDYASIIIGKELADKIEILPGPYSAKAVIYKMLNSCGKRTTSKTPNLKEVIGCLDSKWKIKCIKEYGVDGIGKIAPILFAISTSLTVDEGEDWNPQFKKSVGYSAEDITKSAEEIAFQVYLECLTVKCYNSIEE